MIYRALSAMVLMWLPIVSVAYGSSFLLYLEAQGIIGYSKLADDVIYYSMMQADVMQKPSLGFDYIQRLTGASGDFGSVAVQARIAYDEYEDKKDIELQLYNAYLKLKARSTDFWIGHNRPALGISSYLDSHGLLLDTLAMQGYGFDRDWGVGIYHPVPWGDMAFSLTTGTGMPIYFEGNYLASARVSRGILNQQNYTWGFSLAYGEPLETMGYHRMSDTPYSFAVAGTDITHLWNNLENRIEVFAGRKDGEDTYAFFWRCSINLLAEGRFKLEAQPVYLKHGSDDTYRLSLGASYMVNGDITVRTAYQYDHMEEEEKVVLQLYFYRKL